MQQTFGTITRRWWGRGCLGLVLAVAACSGGSDETADDIARSDDALTEGVFHITVVGDPASDEKIRRDYFIELTDGRWVPLSFELHPEWVASLEDVSRLPVRPETRVVVAGHWSEDQRLIVQELGPAPGAEEDTGSTSAPLIAASPRKVAVILANFAGNPVQPITVAGARDMVFSAANSSNAYWKDVSFGIRSLTGKTAPEGDVFGWYTINASPSGCDYSAWGTAARNAAQAAGVNLTGYDHIVHYFPRTSSCGWAGVGQVPGRYTWINGSTASTIAHELGHNFNLHHSASYSCTENGARVPFSSTSSNCTTSEYGDPFDVMGRGYYHINAFQKGRAGFLETANTVTVTQTGTYTVVPLERKSEAGIQSLKIPVDSANNFYVEFRQPSGFDNFSASSSVVNGVLIHHAPGYTTLARPLLLDMNPATTSFNDAALAVGRTFTAGNISITLNSVASSGASVTVTLGGGSQTNAPPTVSLTSPAAGATFSTGATVTLQATAADSDGSVTRVDFYRGSTLIGSDTSAPYSYAWSGVTAGTHSLSARAIDNGGASTTSTAVSVTVRDGSSGSGGSSGTGGSTGTGGNSGTGATGGDGGSGATGGTGGTGATGGSGATGGTGGSGGSSGGTGTPGPCDGLCSSPVTFAGPSFSSGSLGSGATCHQTTSTLRGGTCGNFAAGRTFKVNGVTVSCSGGSWTPPPKVNGGYCFQASAGYYSWAYFGTW